MGKVTDGSGSIRYVEINGYTYQGFLHNGIIYFFCDSNGNILTSWDRDDVRLHYKVDNVPKDTVYYSQANGTGSSGKVGTNAFNPFYLAFYKPAYENDYPIGLVQKGGNTDTYPSYAGITGHFKENVMPQKTYTISYSGSTRVDTVNAGSSVTLPDNPVTGYTFNGWYTAASGGARVGGAGDSYTPTSDITLYAQFTANTYTIYFHAEGGSVTHTSLTVIYNSADNSDIYWLDPTRYGYTFDGWYTASGETQVYDANGKCTTNGGYWSTAAHWQGTSDLHLYAHWIPITCIVKFNANGGENTEGDFGKENSDYGKEISILYLTYGDSAYHNLTSSIPVRSGYVFDGWYTASGETQVYTSTGHCTTNGGYWSASGNDDTATPVWLGTSDTTFYAHWLPTFTINYYNPTGSIIETKTVTYPNKPTISNLPSVTDGVAVGWSISRSEMEGEYYAGKVINDWADTTTLNLYYFTLSKAKNIKICYAGTDKEISKLRLSDKIKLKWEIPSDFNITGISEPKITVGIGVQYGSGSAIILVTKSTDINNTYCTFDSSLKEIITNKDYNPKDYIGKEILFLVNRDVSYDYSDNNREEFSARARIQKVLNSSGIVHVKDGNTWKEGQVWVHNGGSWKEATTVYVKDNNEWKESI